MRLPSRPSGALRGGLFALVTAAMLIACGGDGGGGSASSTTPTTPMAGATVAVGDTVALTASGKLVSFNRTAPATLVGSIAVTGLAAGDTLLGLDFRPVDGKLYAIGSLGNVYRVDPSTGIATLTAALTPAIGDNRPFTKLDGTRFGIGYNGVSDRLRIVSDTGQNLHVNVGNGATVTDTPLDGATARIAAVAHTNALPGAVSTHLYDIDGSTGTIWLQALNDGTLSTPVPLGVSAATVGGFSIDARNNNAYAALTVAGSIHLYTVPLSAGGAAVDLGTIGGTGGTAGGEAVLGLALSQPLVVTIVALTADGAKLLLFDAAAPGTITSTLPITGLDAGETVLGFDYRQTDKRLYGLTSSARIVTLDTTTGAATRVSTLAADPADATSPYSGLTGTKFSVDFDPVEDRLRVISDTGANLRIDVATGAVVTGEVITGFIYDQPLGMPSVVAAAYGHSYAGATSATLYGYVVDPVNGGSLLTAQSPADDGVVRGIGYPAFDLTPGVAMDIAGGDDGLVLVAAQIVPGEPWVIFSQQLKFNADYLLYRNPSTSNYAASYIGGPQGPAIIDIAIQPL